MDQELNRAVSEDDRSALTKWLAADHRIVRPESDDKLVWSEKMDRIHSWFGLTYAQYLTIPRSVLQSMPDEWQDRFVTCLEELDEAIDWRPSEGRYWVQLKDARGRYVEDPLMDYDRGRRVIARREQE